MSKLMRVSEAAFMQLESLSKLTGEPKQKLVDKAIMLFAHEQALKKANEQYAVLRKNKQAWQEMLNEREEWDVALSDGLDHDKS